MAGVGGEKRVSLLFLLVGALCPLPEGGESVHVLNGKQEGVAVRACPSPPKCKAPKPLWGVCGRGGGGAAGETGFLCHSLRMTGLEALWQVG